jgi:GT2 family glycosyltransferase
MTTGSDEWRESTDSSIGSVQQPPDSTLPFVTVILAARNDAEALHDCLTSLTRIRYPVEKHEIMVVDNGSTDGSAEIIRRFPVTYLREPRAGVCWARNCGIEASRGEILAFTDPDCTVSTGWLRGLVQPFSASRVGCVAGGIVPYPPRTLPELHAARRRSHTQERPLSHPVRPYAMTPNVAIRRAVFEQIGLFDTKFPGGGWEDADLSWRLLEQTSFTIDYAPDAMVFHRYRDTYGQFFVQHYRYGFGLGVLARKYRLGQVLSERPRAAQEVPRACWNLMVSVVGYASQRLERESLGLRYLDLLRVTAQQAGFVAARLSARRA